MLFFVEPTRATMKGGYRVHKRTYTNSKYCKITLQFIVILIAKQFKNLKHKILNTKYLLKE